MEWLWEALKAHVSAIITMLRNVGRALYNGTWGIWLAVVACFEFFVAVVDFIGELVQKAFSKVAEMIGLVETLPTGGSIAEDWYMSMNYFFPLSEAILSATVLAAMYVTASIIRVAKSWVPTLS